MEATIKIKEITDLAPINMDKKLLLHIKENVIKKYNLFDKAHDLEHLKNVLKNIIEILKEYEVNPIMMYVIGCYHDIGIEFGRDNHEKKSAIILKENRILEKYFSNDEITIMENAVEDHRASSKIEPRTIYGKIISEADRDLDYFRILKRAINFSLYNYPNFTKEEHYLRVLNHINVKYGEKGYLTSWLKTRKNEEQICIIRKNIIDKEKFRQDFFEIFYVENTSL